MRGLANSILAGMFAVFLLLALLGSLMGLRPSTPPVAATAAPPGLSGVDVGWRSGELQLTMLLHNTGRIVEPMGVEYEARIGGEVVGRGVQARTGLPSQILPGEQEAVRATLPLFTQAGWTLWEQQAAAGSDAPRLVVEGTLALRSDDGVRRIPFEWRSQPAAAGASLAAALEDVGGNCGGASRRLCLSATQARWDDGRVAATLTLRNPSGQDVRLGNGTATLLLAGVEVASAQIPADGPVVVDAGGHAVAALGFQLGPAPMREWWDRHVAQCERSEVALEVRIPVASLDENGEAGRVSITRWDLDGGVLHTGLACGGPA